MSESRLNQPFRAFSISEHIYKSESCSRFREYGEEQEVWQEYDADEQRSRKNMIEMSWLHDDVRVPWVGTQFPQKAFAMGEAISAVFGGLDDPATRYAQDFRIYTIFEQEPLIQHTLSYLDGGGRTEAGLRPVIDLDVDNIQHEAANEGDERHLYGGEEGGRRVAKLGDLSTYRANNLWAVRFAIEREHTLTPLLLLAKKELEEESRVQRRAPDSSMRYIVSVRSLVGEIQPSMVDIAMNVPDADAREAAAQRTRVLRLIFIPSNQQMWVAKMMIMIWDFNKIKFEY